MTATEPTGFAHTDSGRRVYFTGKVQIGLRSGEKSAAPREHTKHLPAMSADAEAIQAALLRKEGDVTRLGHQVVLWGCVAGLAVMCALLIGGM